MTEYRIEIYATADGREPFADWMERLRSDKAKRAVLHRIQRLKLGLFGDCKTLQACEGLRELRIDLGPGYRVYFARVGNRLLLLLAGGNKGSQKRDIQQATKWLEQYREENEREKIPQL